MKRAVVIVVLLVGVALAVWAATRRKEPAARDPSAAAQKGSPQKGGPAAAANRIIPVVVAPAALRDVPIFLDGLGTVQAWRTVTVRSQVDGRLDRVLFQEGQEVKRGQQLAQIDPRPFLVQLHNAEGALARDRAQLENGKVNLERFTQLREKKMVAQQQVDDQAALVAQLEGSIHIDLAAVESAKLNLDYARIISPVDGVTGVRLVDPGNIIRAADATQSLVIITQLDPIAVIFTVPQDELNQITQAMAREELPVDAFSRDGQVKLATGKLALIDNQINQTTATLRLKAAFRNPQRLLWPNQFVKARLLLTTRKGALVIQNSAVLRGQDGTFVFVAGNDQTAQQRPVEIELTQGDLALVAKGLQAGELVVVEGQNQLRQGSQVQPRPAPQRTAAAKDTGMGVRR